MENESGRVGELEAFNEDGASRMIFVEDKLSTLIKVANDKRLSKWDLFFVDWGYNTEDERQVAQTNTG